MSTRVKNMTNEKQIMNAEEVSRWLRIPKSTLYKLCSKGDMPCTKIGRHWRFKKVVLETWFERKVKERAEE